jgi:uncharacterized protein YjiS (DUF1127 family)
MSAPAQVHLRECYTEPGRPTVSHGGWQSRLRLALRGWRARQEDRRVLASLTERDFQDMGRTRWELEYELARPFWRG